MDVRQLEYFMHVANTLNITHAAMRAHVSQPALSRQIRLLEQELGTKLFKRKARGVVLTETGQRLVDRTRVLLSNVGRIKSEIMSSADEPVGTVRLAASNSLSGLLTSRVVARFRRTYPQVSVHVTENTSMIVRESIANDGADVALLSDRESFTTLTKMPLVTESLLLIAPLEVGLDLSRPVSAKSLTGHNLILTPFPNGLRRAVDEILVRAGRVAEPKLEVDTNSLMTSLTKYGTGYCVLPYSGVHELLVRKEVSAAPIRNVRWGWVTAVSRERAMSTATKKLIEMIAEEAQVLTSNGTWKTATLDLAQNTGKHIGLD
ncbi:LysR family transcriptional regulator [Mesorhizobium sp. B3-1-9]|uniref:LysR family transcriptional regulator n=1 Tax=Mesorhizobium sp. B3-1-9 TaxID=2589892 RepID=UPI001129EA8B|nr:LysR family transcriptional regulator [Mesorhizobium sp. B3-1-9]TPI38138.1 LysR family transcriptional regulator [Mesorhizobium sp. B3-1-9]